MNEPNVVRLPLAKSLPVPLTQEEKDGYMERAMNNRARMVELEDEKKAYNNANKEAQDGCAVRMDDAMAVLRRGLLDKEVPCEEVRNYNTGSVCMVRLDTGEIVSERAMSYDERQQALQFAPTMSLGDRNQALIDEAWAAWEAEEAAREEAEGLAEAEAKGAIPMKRREA